MRAKTQDDMSHHTWTSSPCIYISSCVIPMIDLIKDLNLQGCLKILLNKDVSISLTIHISYMQVSFVNN